MRIRIMPDQKDTGLRSTSSRCCHLLYKRFTSSTVNISTYQTVCICVAVMLILFKMGLCFLISLVLPVDLRRKNVQLILPGSTSSRGRTSFSYNFLQCSKIPRTKKCYMKHPIHISNLRIIRIRNPDEECNFCNWVPAFNRVAYLF